MLKLLATNIHTCIGVVNRAIITDVRLSDVLGAGGGVGRTEAYLP